MKKENLIIGSIFVSLLLVMTAVFSAGFHYPSEIVPGAFQNGNYSFNGSLGIGTNSPKTNLEIAGRWFVNEHGISPLSGVGMFGSYNPTLNSGIIQAYDYTNSIPKNIIMQSAGGNVGIGTSNPSGKLHVSSSGSSVARFDRSSNLMGFEAASSASGGFGLYDYATSVFQWYAKAGNVGIGTTAPTSLLQLSAGAPTLAFDANTQGANLKRVRFISSVFTSGDLALQSMNDDGSIKSTSIVIQNGGNVGIGTTTPLRALHIKSAAGTAQIESTGTSGTLYFGDITSSVIDNQGIGSRGNSIAIATGGSDKFTVLSSGNVGIGTTNPQAKLDIRGTDSLVTIGNSNVLGERLELKYDSVNNYGWIRSLTTSGDNGPLIIQGDGGNVGIGTTSPQAKLDVKGAITVSDVNVANQGSIKPIMTGGRKTISTNQWVELFKIGHTSSGTIDATAIGPSGQPTSTYISQFRAQIAYGAGYLTSLGERPLGTKITDVNFDYLNTGGTESNIIRIYVASTDPTVDLSWSYYGVSSADCHQI